jgi:hypothetical protein
MLFVNNQTLNYIANNIENDLTSQLIEEAVFRKIGVIDDLVPDEKGLYCIRLVDELQLPD